MSIVYLLFYDKEEGSSEEWNTFCTPCEAFATTEARTNRINDLTPGGYFFHKLDLEVSG